jgi:replicative DNA helicase
MVQNNLGDATPHNTNSNSSNIFNNYSTVEQKQETELIDEILKLIESGLSLIPICRPTEKTDKNPPVEWTPFQTRKPNIIEINQWIKKFPNYGWAIVTGEVSGNLEVLDLESVAPLNRYKDLVNEFAPDLLCKLPLVQTPTGGWHIYYRCESIGRNQKLAQYKKDDGKVATLIETRAEGGYILSPLCPPGIHRNGGVYTLLNGNLNQIPTITPEEREKLFAAAWACNEVLKNSVPKGKTVSGGEPKRVGDDYNQRANVCALLEKHGWTLVESTNKGEHWARPFVSHTSATLFDSGVFYVFSTNAHPLEANQAYSPFGLFAELEHGGDYSAAAKDLAAQGFGNSGKQSSSMPEGISVSEKWEAPTPFTHYNLPEFPLGAFPQWLSSYCAKLAYSTQTPNDLSALMALLIFSAAVAGKFVVRVTGDWVENLNLYLANVLGVGNRKTAVVDAVIAPLEDYENRLIADKQAEISAIRIERETLEERLSYLKKAAGKETEIEQRKLLLDEAKSIGDSLVKMKVPAIPKLMASGDITPEAISMHLAEQEGRLFVCSDEGDLFELLAGRYNNNNPNIEIVLKAHTGSKIRVDRRGRSEVVDAATLTIALAVQPDVIRGLASKKGFDGRGLLARFLYSIPHSLVGHRVARTTPLSADLKKLYARYVTKLAETEKSVDGNGKKVARAILLSSEAQELVYEFLDELEPKLGEDGELHTIGAWASKLTGAIVRIAGILHLIDNADNPYQLNEIPATTMQRAIKIGRYLISHAQTAFAEMGADPQIENAKFILRWIIKHRKNSFTRRDTYNDNRGRFKTAPEVDPALSLLEAHGYIRPVLSFAEAGKVGRKSSQQFEVNPFVFSPTQNPQNTQKEMSITANDDSAYSAYSAQPLDTNLAIKPNVIEKLEPVASSSDNEQWQTIQAMILSSLQLEIFFLWLSKKKEERALPYEKLSIVPFLPDTAQY